MDFRLDSGLIVHDPLARLLRFCREEYEYYDAIPNSDPNRIEPLDVLATVGVNSRLDTATKVRTVHRGMAACEPTLRRIAPDAHLQTFERIDDLHDLFGAAMKSKYVLLATATKVLHRKRPHLVPVLDSVVAAYYIRPEERNLLQRSWESRSAAADVGRITMERLRDDLVGAIHVLDSFRRELGAEGFRLSHVRILDILVWTEKELSGYYRS